MIQVFGQLETWQVQYAYLLALLQANALATESLGIAAGGQAVRISEVSPPSEGTYPAIGIQFLSRNNKPSAQRRREQENTFDITVAWDMPFSITDQDIDRTLKISIENLLNDGNGHGLLPLLTQDTSLGGTARMSIDQEVMIALGRSDDENAGASGRALITFVAVAEQQYT
jgi:hypothetical protein